MAGGRYPRGFSDPHRAALQPGDIVTDGAVCAAAEVWQTIGNYTVPAGTGYELGFGNLEGLESATGRLYIALMTDVPAIITGRYRLVILNTTETRSQVIVDLPNPRASSAAAANLEGQMPFPRQRVLIREYEHIRLQVYPDAAGQGPVDQGECEVLIDCSRLSYNPAAA